MKIARTTQFSKQEKKKLPEKMAINHWLDETNQTQGKTEKSALEIEWVRRPTTNENQLGHNFRPTLRQKCGETTAVRMADDNVFGFGEHVKYEDNIHSHFFELKVGSVA